MNSFALVATLFFVFLFTACGSQKATTAIANNTSTDQVADIQKEATNKPTYRTMSDRRTVPVSDTDFVALVDFIEKKGVSTGDGDMQYTFFDSKKNRHALMTIKRDENNKPSKQGKVVQISVWAYYKGIKDQEHFFGWYIRDGEAGLFSPEQEQEDKHFANVKFGYEEFLAKVKTASK